MLASIEAEKGNFAVAVSSYEKSISILEIIKGSENVDSFGNLNSLINCYIKLERYRDAIEVY